MRVAMRSLFALIGASVLSVACAEPPSAPPRAARSSAAPTAAPHVETVQEMQARQAAEFARSYQAAADEQKRQQAAFSSQQQQMQDMVAQANRANEQRQREKVESARSECSASRESRLTHARQVMAWRINAEARVLKHAKAILSTCTLRTRRTGAVSVQASGSGWRVAPELADDVQCSGPLPGGLSKDDAYVILFRKRDGAPLGPTGVILQTEDTSSADESCAAFDREIGLDYLSVAFDDGPALERVLRWKPSTDADAGASVNSR